MKLIDLYKEYRKGSKYTPQTLAREIYEKTFQPINYQLELGRIKLAPKEQQEELKDNLDFIKSVEIAIIEQKFFQKIDLQKYQNLEPKEEKKINEPLLEIHRQEIQEQAPEIAFQARKINN